MKRTTILISALFFWLPAAFALDYLDGELSEDVWYIDTVVMINGNNLHGPLPSQDKLCFAPEADKDDLRCFLSSHNNITKWTSCNITFVPPKNTPPKGVVIIIQPEYKEECAYIYSKKQCSTSLIKNKYQVASYIAHPHISTVIDATTGSEAMSLEPDKTYEIQGYRFGDAGRGIYIDKKMIDHTNIQRWTHDSIIFTAPKSALTAASLQVNNGAGMGNEWRFTESNVITTTIKTKTRGIIVQTSTFEASVVNKNNDSVDNPIPYSDVSNDHPYYNAISWGTYNGILEGYSDGTFRPDENVNRAEFLKIIFEANGINDLSDENSENVSFSDVVNTSWYAPYIAHAQSSNIIQGYPDGYFRPDQEVNAAEALKMAYRLYAIPTIDPQGDEWYARYFEHAQANGIFFDSGIYPDSPLSRKDVVWIVLRLLEKN